MSKTVAALSVTPSVDKFKAFGAGVPRDGMRKYGRRRVARAKGLEPFGRADDYVRRMEAVGERESAKWIVGVGETYKE